MTPSDADDAVDRAGSPPGPALSTAAGADPAPALRHRVRDGLEVWLIRHGETEWSRSGQHTGRTDIPLTAAGERQAEALRDLLGALRPVFVISSPRRRALDTARLAGLTVDDIDDDLAEWDYGDYEGRTTVDIRREVPGWTLWTHGVPNGETAEQVGARADRVLSAATAVLDREATGPVVLVAHGHISRVIGARWIELPPQGGAHLALNTAAPSVLGAQHGIPVLDRWNIPNPALSGPIANGGPGD